MTPGNQCLALIQEFEGCELTAYQDSVGIWTIGYGHTGNVIANEKITFSQALTLLYEDVESTANQVNKLVNTSLNQAQYDALISFVFNVGSGNFKRSTLLKTINQKDFTTAAMQFPLWVYAGGVKLEGLVRRRLAEQALFVSQD